jgi:hypothetical protein
MSFELPISSNSPPHSGDSLQAVCRMLRTKTAFGTYTSTGEDWRMGDSTTAVYWCLDTMSTSGPDDDLAHPHSCCQNRTCFKPELD